MALLHELEILARLLVPNKSALLTYFLTGPSALEPGVGESSRGRLHTPASSGHGNNPSSFQTEWILLTPWVHLLRTDQDLSYSFAVLCPTDIMRALRPGISFLRSHLLSNLVSVLNLPSFVFSLLCGL